MMRTENGASRSRRQLLQNGRSAYSFLPGPGIMKGEEMDEQVLLQRITVNPSIFGGKPIIKGRRLAVEHVLGMLAAGDTPEILLQGYPWLEKEDIQACLVYARVSVV